MSTYLNKEAQVQRKFNKLKKDNPNKSEEELLSLAKEEIEAKYKVKEVEIDAKFLNVAEKKYAQSLLKKYLEDYTIETVSDRNTLSQLIYLEVLQSRLQDALNEFYQLSKAVPKEPLDSIHKNTDKIISLKNTLGITRTKQEETVKDAYSYVQMLFRKRKRWLQENQASRYLTCPHCSKAVLLKIKTDAWEAQKHPFFRDRILGNEHLIELYKQNKLSREDLAKVFQTSADYVDWLVERCWKLPSVANDEKQKQA